jgi:alpha,alpha-trehalase
VRCEGSNNHIGQRAGNVRHITSSCSRLTYLEAGLSIIGKDPKDRSPNPVLRVYVPFHDSFALDYYQNVAKRNPALQVDVIRLPEHITPEYVKSLNHVPGLLSLALRREIDSRTGQEIVKGTPFVVPGGRFNEMYGWDSYFESLGLLLDERGRLAEGMVENFCESTHMLS